MFCYLKDLFRDTKYLFRDQKYVVRYSIYLFKYLKDLFKYWKYLFKSSIWFRFENNFLEVLVTGVLFLWKKNPDSELIMALKKLEDIWTYYGRGFQKFSNFWIKGFNIIPDVYAVSYQDLIKKWLIESFDRIYILCCQKESIVLVETYYITYYVKIHCKNAVSLHHLKI